MRRCSTLLVITKPQEVVSEGGLSVGSFDGKVEAAHQEYVQHQEMKQEEQQPVRSAQVPVPPLPFQPHSDTVLPPHQRCIRHAPCPPAFTLGSPLCHTGDRDATAGRIPLVDPPAALAQPVGPAAARPRQLHRAAGSHGSSSVRKRGPPCIR